MGDQSKERTLHWNKCYKKPIGWTLATSVSIVSSVPLATNKVTNTIESICFTNAIWSTTWEMVVIKCWSYLLHTLATNIYLLMHGPVVYYEVDRDNSNAMQTRQLLAWITTELIKVRCAQLGSLNHVLHCDQGKNFESKYTPHTHPQDLQFGAAKSCATAYHSQGDCIVV